MDRTRLEEAIAAVDRQIAMGDTQIVDAYDNLAMLVRNGRDYREALGYLDVLEDTQIAHTRRRDQLLEQLRRTPEPIFRRYLDDVI